MMFFFEKVDIPFHIPGTAVRVLNDIAVVNELQTTGPGWNDDIALVGLMCVYDNIPTDVYSVCTYMCGLAQLAELLSW